MSTIKKVAEKANVSIATVSHIINKTRYVSPDLEQRVYDAMETLNYIPKERSRVPKQYKATYIGVIIHMNDLEISNQLIAELNNYCREEPLSYKFCLVQHDSHAISAADLLYYQKRFNLEGIILVNLFFNLVKEKRISTFPIVFFTNTSHQMIKLSKDLPYTHISLDFHTSLTTIFELLSNKGHEHILYLYHDAEKTEEICQSLTDIYLKRNLAFAENSLCLLSSQVDPDLLMINQTLALNTDISAIVTLDEDAYHTANYFFNQYRVQIPEDYSFFHLSTKKLYKNLSYAFFDFKKVSSTIIQALKGFRKGQSVRLPSLTHLGTSVSSIAKGPFGEKATDASVLELSIDELNLIKQADYSVGICFHQSDTFWTKLHEKGIRDVLEPLGISIISVMNANFDPELQNEQHKSLIRMKVDAIISIPVDEKITASSYQEVIDHKIKLVLITNIPEGISRTDYATCISVNELQNGENIGRLAGNFMLENELTYLGMITHGANFFATKQRDQAFRQVITEEFPAVELSESRPFFALENVQATVKKMIEANPIIQVLYICWEEPARLAMDVLKQMNREDIKIFTTDLDYTIAIELAKESQVMALSTQQPYEQGRAMALATLNSFLEKELPSFIAIEPLAIQHSTLEKGWEIITKEKLPAEIASYYH